MMPLHGSDRSVPQKSAAIAIRIHGGRRSALLPPVGTRERLFRRDALHEAVNGTSQFDRLAQIPSGHELVEPGESGGKCQLSVIQELQAVDLALERVADGPFRFRDLAPRSIKSARTTPSAKLEPASKIGHQLRAQGCLA